MKKKNNFNPKTSQIYNICKTTLNMSTQTVYVKASDALNQLLDARIFSENYSIYEKTEIQLDDAYDALCKLEFYLVSTKDEFICMDKIDSLFDKLYKPLKKASYLPALFLKIEEYLN